METSRKIINLDRSRDFGGNIETTIDFAKENYLNICKGILFVIPVALIAAYFMDPMEQMMGSTSVESMAQMLGNGSILAQIISAVASLLVSLYTITYMSEYRRSNGEVDKSVVWDRVKKNIGPVILAGILFGIMIFLGFILCIIPGIALMGYLAFYVFEIIEEDAEIVASFKGSYALVKDNWWSLFIYYFVVAIVISIISGIFYIPLMFPIFAIFLGTESIFTSSIYIYFAAALVQIAAMFLAPITYIALGSFYYSLRSKKNNNEIEDMIDNIGSQGNQNNY